MGYLLAAIITLVLILVLSSGHSIQDRIRKKLDEEEKTKKGTNNLEQQLRDEDKYDNDYRKRHS